MIRRISVKESVLMGGSNLFAGKSSFKLGSSSIGRGNGVDVFSRSVHSHREDDEEALKWAAIEKLPTFDRLRKGLLKEPLGTGTTSEVDVKGLGFEERKNLLERLVKTADEDNEKFLLRLRNRVDRVGIDLPTIEVRFENLNVEGEALVGSQALPTFFSFSINLFEKIFGFLGIFPNRKKPFPILRNVSGIIKPCRMALLLGPPSSGKTTLLLALAGKLDPDLKFTGKVTYNGHSMSEFVPRRTSAYISQYDLHIGEITVRETLAFSARCQGVGSRYEMLAELSRREKAANIKPDPDIDIYMKAEATEGQEASVVTDYVLKVLGLDICADTMVGDDMLRGISGGQKKRVTTGEMLVGPSKVLLMDEISTGLDSSTTFQIVKSLRQYVHILKGTALISLLQPAPETYDLFDDIILVSNNQIAYQGPREQVLPFFKAMGFQCPDRKGVADFLQEVTSEKDQRQYWDRNDAPYRFVTVNEFAESFKKFHVGQQLADELAVPFDKTKSHPAALATKMYGVSKKELLKACFAREVLLMKRNSFVYIFKLMQLALLAFVAMTVYLRTKMHRHSVTDGGIYLGALFFSIQMIFFNGISEIFMTVWKLPVFYKQRDLLFFPAWAYAIPSWILKIPFSAMEVLLWVILTYYVIGYDPNIGRFGKHIFILFLLHQASSGLYRFTGAAGKDPVLAYTYGLYALSVMSVMSGFVLSRKDLKKWWLWGYWTSPVMYASNAVFSVEFLGTKWKHIPTNATESLGVLVMKSRGFFAEKYWYWLGVAALVGMTIIFNIFFTLALTFLNSPGKSQAFIADDSETSVSNGEENSSARRSQSRARKQQIEGSFSADQNRKKGMALPFEQHSITFDEIVYSVDMPQEMKDQGADENRLMLLKGVSGVFRPGVLTALMGVSGAGKTTLMDVLAGRKTGGYIDGNISISGYPKRQETFARIAGYCEQNDIHSPHVTVYESLVYSAWLRLSSDVDSETRKTFVEEVMELVELSPLREALVGFPGVNGLSTEQRKRLTIAVELVANPSIIFMDEPTSGLDARAAAIVMRTVRNTVDTGRTVVCTIHQPGIDIFEAFDELFLMKRGGQEIYVGPLGHNSCHLINYFEGIEGVSKIKDGYNPATWMLEVSAASQELVLGVDFTELYKNSELYRRNKALIGELSTPRPGSKDLYFPTQYSQSFFIQCMACLWKQKLSYWRNPPYNAVRFYFTLSMALAIGSMFWDLGGKRSKRQDLFNALGEVYIASFFLGVHTAASVQPVVAVEQIVFYRERAAGMYSAMPYAFGQVIIELPYAFALIAVYVPITYAMAGMQWTVAKFLWNFFFSYLTLLYFTFYGMLTVAVTPNQNIAAIVATLFYSFWNLFSGFLIPRTRIPVWWRWFYWTSPVAWSLYGLIVSQYGDRHDVLDTGETIKEFLNSYFGYKHDFLGVVAAGVLGFTVLFAFIFGLAIKFINYQRR